MNMERERKFLVRDDSWRREAVETLLLRQGYLSTEPGCAVRVRLGGEKAWLTIKGERVGGAAPEFEYPIPVPDAVAMLETLAKRPIIEKKRHMVPHEGFVWEVDEFFGDNAGLVIAEIELAPEDQAVPLPAWAGEEVTGDPKYYNASLVARSFKDW